MPSRPAPVPRPFPTALPAPVAPVRSAAILAAVLVLGVALVLGAAAVAAPFPRFWQEKVDPGLLAAAARGETEVLVLLAEQAELAPLAEAATKREKGRRVYETLTRLADRTQPAVVEVLEAAGVPHRRYWIVNMIWTRADAAVLEELARRDDVRRLEPNPRVRLAEPEPAHDAGKAARGVEWNVAMIEAPAMWARGYTGEGAVIGGIDTGYDWDHPALLVAYRGWDGLVADHDHNWHDAIHTPDSDCGADSPEPCDDGSHGTHTMGIMAGDDGGENRIGVAPGARWIGCRCMEEGFGTPATYMECLQWMIAPTEVGGADPDPDLAPDVINNSWVCPPSEGCVDPEVLRPAVEAVRAAGIVVVASAGNDGAGGCETVQNPPAIYDAAFSIGAVDADELIADFSSRGPVTVDASWRLKPDLAAPGVSVRSAVPPDEYRSFSGTSMAGPHAAGAAALLIGAHPQLAGNVDAVEAFLRTAAQPRTADEDCGGVSGLLVPNNTYGHGLLDVLAAHELVLGTVADVPAGDVAGVVARLGPAVPNPFNPVTELRLDLRRPATVDLAVHDAAGRLVRILARGEMLPAGAHAFRWDGRDRRGRGLPSGVYFARLAVEGTIETRRLTLLR